MAKKQLEINIEKFNEKGVGIAFNGNGTKIVISRAIIGDKILAELNKKRKGYIKARILKVIEPSKNRINPKCKSFEICGGCSWQNLEYSEQLKQKEKLVIKNFEDYIKKTNLKLYPIFPAKEIFEYRNKMEFSFSQNQKKTMYLGLIMLGGRFVVDIERCFLANEWFSNVLKEVKTWWERCDFSAYNFFNGEGFLRTLTLKEGKNTKDKMVVLTTSTSTTLDEEQKRDFISSIIKAIGSDNNLSIYLNEQRAKKGEKTTFELTKLFGKDFIKEDLYIKVDKSKIKLSFQIGPHSFFQPNTIQAQNLYSLAINYLNLEEIKDKVIFDLYSGTGTIGMILAKFVKKVIAIEINQDSCNQAKDNLKLNNINNFEMINGDVSLILDEILKDKNFEKPHLIVIDPPRGGLSLEAIENILKILPKNILYISCNPKTQARDIKILTENGYQLKILHPIDQFAQTFHIENIAVLENTL
ncbi:MAG: 23S rRNA (uracil-C(5))-methyltransferase RlmCD [Candidatus Anoxychlamydiales bacterium]|nr:23S rRNA (uracil-C(5))-methyltransferase RlmCD [Candidatus Anoxychlamydiales bacterium]NGX36135.1 23S rRNA (uracil-C(5))-methyltransferase RlmCD [Candidatus Anoxychlamydiales bacterium]